MRREAAAGAGVLAVLLLAAAILVLEPWQRHPARNPGAMAPAAAPAHPAKPAPPPAAAKPRPPEAPRFDVVRVAPDGSAVIAGRAAPGATVTVLDNGRALGTVTADPRGEWVLVPQRPLPPGQRRLSLEASNPQGGGPIASKQAVAVSVAAAPAGSEARPPAAGVAPARAETAAASAQPQPAGAAAGTTYVVKSGNSLWRIAHEVYGAGIRYLGIYSANSGKIGNPNLIFPGQVLKLPKQPERPPARSPAQG